MPLMQPIGAGILIAVGGRIDAGLHLRPAFCFTLPLWGEKLTVLSRLWESLLIQGSQQ